MSVYSSLCTTVALKKHFTKKLGLIAVHHKNNNFSIGCLSVHTPPADIQFDKWMELNYLYGNRYEISIRVLVQETDWCSYVLKFTPDGVAGNPIDDGII